MDKSVINVYLCMYFSNTCNWFIKIDDDTILNIDAIKLFLSCYNYNNNHYIEQSSNRRINLRQNVVYNGGAMYILSQNAFKKWYYMN